MYVCLVAIMVLAVLPGNYVRATSGWDKMDHFLAFALLGLIGLRAWPRREHQVFAVLLAYGGLIELFQAILPYRFAELRDLFADAAGLVLAFAVGRTQLRSAAAPGAR
jgi:VanZ family protein